MNDMANIVQYDPNELQVMAEQVAKSGLFPGFETKEKAFSLMLLCQAKNMHPATAMLNYDIIQGRPSMKAKAMQAEFQRHGGTVEWLESNDKVCRAKFTHPNGKTEATVEWTIEKAEAIGLTSKNNWKNYPAQMLRARTVSEGVGMVMPEVNLGLYTPEEVMDFDDNFNGSKKPETIKIVNEETEIIDVVPTVEEIDNYEKVPPSKVIDNSKFINTCLKACDKIGIENYRKTLELYDITPDEIDTITDEETQREIIADLRKVHKVTNGKGK
jgi:hypothetical protein